MQRPCTALEALQRIINEASDDSNGSSVDNRSDSEPDDVIEDFTSSDEDDPVADIVQQIGTDANKMMSTNGQDQWSKLPLPENNNLRPQAHNILCEAQGPTNFARNICGQSPKQAFQLFLTEEVVREIVRCTNLEGSRRHQNWTPTSVEEQYCFYGVLLLAGAHHENHTRVSELWSEVDGRPIFNKAMSRNRFTDLMACLRFDDREQRNPNDKFSPLRSIFGKIVKTFQKVYKAGAAITVDEQLVKFRGRCRFKMYIPSKPGKYGIKLWALTDADTYYCLNLLPYVGRTGNVPEKHQGQRVVLELTNVLTGTGRNVFMDNFFTSLQLARTLLGRQLTMTGTMRKNKPELPKEMLPSNDRPELSSQFGFQKNVAVVSYVPKKKKAVILLSTFQLSNAVSEDGHKKPLMIMEYNKGKCGVDTLDQLVRMYSCIRKCNRWPMVLFMNLLDIAAYNALASAFFWS